MLVGAWIDVLMRPLAGVSIETLHALIDTIRSPSKCGSIRVRVSMLTSNPVGMPAEVTENVCVYCPYYGTPSSSNVSGISISVPGIASVAISKLELPNTSSSPIETRCASA